MVPQPQDAPDITNYWQYFNLHCDPFAMQADKALYFVPTKWEEIVDLLQYISHYKNQLMLVTGDSGVGKTTLAELLIEQINDTMHIGRMTAEGSIDVSRLIERISDLFTVSWQPEQPLEQMLNEELSALQQKDRPSLLVIDNAHLLPFETLEALLYLVGQQSEHQMHFHVLLLGENSLTQTFQRLLEPDEESLVHPIQLNPLSMDETSLYLGHRLAVAGWQEDIPLTDEIITRIYRLSEGNPARINRIARRALLDMLTQDKEETKVSLLQRYGNKLIGSGVVLIVLILGATWLLKNSQQASDNETKPTISVNGQDLNTSVSSDDKSQVNLPLPPALNTPAGANGVTPPPAGAPVPSAADTTSGTTTATSSVTTATTTPSEPTTASADSAMPHPIAVTAKGTSVSETPTAPLAEGKPQTAVNAMETTAPATTTVPAATAPEEAPVADEAPAAPPATEPPVKTGAKTPAVAKIKAVAKTQAEPVVDKAAVKTVVEKAKPAYGLELLNVTSRKALNTLLQQYPSLKAKMVVIPGKGDKIKVFYGHYPTLAAASQALTKVPAELQSAKLWPNQIPAKVMVVKHTSKSHA